MTLIPGTDFDLQIVNNLYDRYKFIACPFCKNERFALVTEGFNTYVECIKCGATGPDAKTIDEAVTNWNGRNG